MVVYAEVKLRRRESTKSPLPTSSGKAGRGDGRYDGGNRRPTASGSFFDNDPYGFLNKPAYRRVIEISRN